MNNNNIIIISITVIIGIAIIMYNFVLVKYLLPKLVAG